MTVPPKVIELPADLPRISPHLGEISFEGIDLLDYIDWDYDVVVRKTEQCLRLMQENVGVQYELLSNTSLGDLALDIAAPGSLFHARALPSLCRSLHGEEY